MNIEELKKSIEDRTYNSPFLILKWQDNSFIATQYANEIGKIRHKEIKYVHSTEECKRGDEIFGFRDNTLKVYIVNDLKIEYEENMEDVVIICKNLKECVGVDDFVVSIPKLEDWQILSYMKYKCPNMNEESLKWLQSITNNDIYRIDNELSKLALFEKQEEFFDEEIRDGVFNDLTTYNIFNISNSISKRDVSAIRDILHRIDSIDVEPYGLITNLLREFKNTLSIQSTNYSFDKLGMSQKQYNAIKYYNCGKYSTQKLIDIYRFLLGFDMNLKNGVYQNVSSMIDYILCKVLG